MNKQICKKEIFEETTTGEGTEQSMEESELDQLAATLDKWDPMGEAYEEGMNHISHDDELAENVFNAADFSADSDICRALRYMGTCRRGDQCRWRHVSPREDALPVDVVRTQCYFQGSVSQPTQGMWVPAIVSHFELPQKFHVQIALAEVPGEEGEASDRAFLSSRGITYVDQFKILQKNLSKFYKKFLIHAWLTPPSVAVGELMVTCNREGPFYGVHRVRVLRHVEARGSSEKNVLVQYVDIGAEHWVDQRALKPIDPQFLTPRPLAIPCYLHGIRISSGGDRGSKNVKLVVSKYVAGKTLVMVVAEDPEQFDDRLGVVLVDPKMAPELTSLNALLVQQGLAVEI